MGRVTSHPSWTVICQCWILNYNTSGYYSIIFSQKYSQIQHTYLRRKRFQGQGHIYTLHTECASDAMQVRSTFWQSHTLMYKWPNLKPKPFTSLHYVWISAWMARVLLLFDVKFWYKGCLKSLSVIFTDDCL